MEKEEVVEGGGGGRGIRSRGGPEYTCDHSHESEILLVNDKSKIPLASRDSCVSV